MSGKICLEVVLSTIPLLFRNCSQIFEVTETGNKGPISLLCLFLCYTYLSLFFRTFPRVSLWLEKENSFFETEGIGFPNTEKKTMSCDLEFLGSYCFYLSFIMEKIYGKASATYADVFFSNPLPSNARGLHPSLWTKKYFWIIIR